MGYPLYFLFHPCLVESKGVYTWSKSLQLNFSVTTHDLEVHFVCMYIYLSYICTTLFFCSLLIAQHLERIPLRFLSPVSFFQIVTLLDPKAVSFLFSSISGFLSVDLCLLKWSIHLIWTPVILSPFCLLSLSFFWYSSSFSWTLSTGVSQGSDFRYLLYFLLTVVLILSKFIT